jgi:hypothetical protein
MGENAHVIIKPWVIDNGLILFSIFDFLEISAKKLKKIMILKSMKI